MADTFGAIWRQVRLHVPNASALLVQSWVTQAYRDIVDKGAWSWLRAQNQIITQASKTGTVNVTQGSNVVTAVAPLTLAATDAGRQIKIITVAIAPVYTITSVNVTAQTCTIDQNFGGVTSATGTATILDAYVTCPSDFGRWLVVVDPANNWQLRPWITDEELNAWDAQRSATGTPWCLSSNMYSTYPPTAGQFRYELWPYQQAAHVYGYWYMRRAEVLTDSTAFIGPLATRGDIILSGALAYAAEWPGPDPDHRNIFFNPNLAQSKRRQFEDQVARLEVIDQDYAPTWYETLSWLTHMPWAPLDSKYMQGHDFSFTAQSDWGSDFVPWIH